MENVREPSTGIAFPERFDPSGGEQHLELAAVAVRKRWLLNVYAFGLYFHAAGAKEELQRWNTYDIDELRANVSFYNHLITTKFSKALRMVMARTIKGSDLKTAFEESIRPRMEHLAQKLVHGHSQDSRKTMLDAGIAALRRFRNQFSGIRLQRGTEICLWNEGDVLHTSINGTVVDSIDNGLLCAALFSVYLGENPISQPAREFFAMKSCLGIVKSNHLTKPSINKRLRDRLNIRSRL